MRKPISLFVSALLPILAAGQPTDGVTWTYSLQPDGNGGSIIEIVGQSDKPLTQIHGSIEWQSCLDDRCFSPKDTVFSIDVNTSETLSGQELPPKTVATLGNVRGGTAGEAGGGVERSETFSGTSSGPDSESNAISGAQRPGEFEGNAPRSPYRGMSQSDRGLRGQELASSNNWKLLLEAILWGLAMLLTPCVFPMVPMTVSFFLKGSENRRRGRFRAIMYGVFIVAIYTLPIMAIVAATQMFGGDVITADIFNTIATHWLPNILFFIIFMVFAASFFGAFEFRLPSSWVNGADKNSDKKGLGGVFFMALTLVLVSFSCTGPIVGTVLIKSVQGSIFTPVTVMLAFSIAFALPFVIFALFPTLMQKLPKSGSWLGRVKIVLGFIELALGLKFLSVADQAYHWNILGREIYLGLWIVIFALLGLYLAGVIRFKGEEKPAGFTFGRLSLVIIDFAFVLYLVQGLWGAPLTALSGYLPPQNSLTSFAYNSDDSLALWAGVRSENRATLGTVRGGTGSEANGGVERSETFSGRSSGPQRNLVTDLPAAKLDEAKETARQTGRNVFLQVSGYACVNCREMEAKVLSDSRVAQKLANDYVTVVLYVDDKTELPQDQWLTTPSGKVLKQIGKQNSYYVMQTFGINSQPSYVLLDPEGKQLKPVRGYNLSVPDFLEFLNIDE